MKNLLQKPIQLLLEIEVYKSSFFVLVGDRRLRVLYIVVIFLLQALRVSLCLWSCLSLTCVCVYVVFWRIEVLSIWNWQMDVDARRNGGLSVSLVRSYILLCSNRLMEVSVSSSHFLVIFLELVCFLGMAFFITIWGERCRWVW